MLFARAEKNAFTQNILRMRILHLEKYEPRYALVPVKLQRRSLILIF